MKTYRVFKFLTAILLALLVLTPCLIMPLAEEESENLTPPDTSGESFEDSSDLPEESGDESSEEESGEESSEESSEEPSDVSGEESSGPEVNIIYVTVMNPGVGSYDIDGYAERKEISGGYVYVFEGETATVRIHYISDGSSKLRGVQYGSEFAESTDERTVSFTVREGCVVSFSINGYATVKSEVAFAGSSESGMYLSVNGEKLSNGYIKNCEASVTAVLPKGLTAEKAELEFSDGSEKVVVYFRENQCTFPAISCDFKVTVTVSGYLTADVDVNWDGEGSVTVPSNTVKKGSVIVFTVAPADGYYAESATLNGRSITLSGGQYTAIANEDLNFYVRFALKPETQKVVLSVDPRASGGEISFKNYKGKTADVPFGEECEILFTPHEGYVLDRVYINGISTTPTGNRITVTVTRGHEIVAAFKRATYKITAVVPKNYGGRIEAVGYTITNGMVSVDHGNSITFRFIPDMGHVISSVKIDGAALQGELAAEYTFTNVNANHTLSVTFVAEGENTKFYTVSVDCGEHGRAEPGNLLDVDEGDDLIISFVPDEGYVVDRVFYDGAPATLTQGKLVLVGINADHIIQVTFKEKPHDIVNVVKATDVDWQPDEVVIDISRNSKVDSSVFEKMSSLYGSKRFTFSNGLFDITLQSGAVMNISGDFAELGYDTLIAPESTEVFLQCLSENKVSVYTVVSLSEAYPTGSAMTITLGQEFSAKTVNVYTFDGSVFRKEKEGIVADVQGRVAFPLFECRTMVIAVDDSAPVNHIVTVNCGANGTSDPMTAQTVADGGKVTIRIFPFDGYMVDTVAVDGVFLELDEAARMNGACELPLSNIRKNTQVDIHFVVMPVEEKSQTGLILLIVIISVAIVGGGALFFVQWKRTKY